jgi:hypothetical protein
VDATMVKGREGFLCGKEVVEDFEATVVVGRTN